MRWAGNVTRMPDCLMTACQNSSCMVSSATANNQLVGKRNASRTPFQKTLTTFNIDVTNREAYAQDRPLWRSMINTGARTDGKTGPRRLRKSVLLARRDFTLPPAPQSTRHNHAPSVTVTLDVLLLSDPVYITHWLLFVLWSASGSQRCNKS